MGLSFAGDADDAAPRLHTHARASISQTTLVQRIVMLAVVCAGWVLRLVALTRQDIWWDEARNIDVALRPFTQIAYAPELDIHPPLYFWLLHLWARIFGLSVGMEPAHLAFGTRLLSVAAGVISVALLYQLARRVSGQARWAGVIAAALGAFSPFWLAESQETRMYTAGFALLLAASVALLIARQRAQRETSDARVHLIAFVVLSALSLLTHYNAVFILAAWYVGWLAWALAQPDRTASLRPWFFCGLATALLVAPFAPIALRQIPVYANPNLTVPSIAEYLAQNWQAYWGGYAFTPALGQGAGTIWLWIVAVVAAGGVMLAWFAARPKVPLLFLLLWVVGGLALYYVAVVDRGAFNVRYSSFVTPALYALVGIGLAAWSRWWQPLAGCLVVVALLIWPQAIAADLYDAHFAREDITGVTNWLRDHAGPGAVIFVDQKYPFGFYYDRYVIDAAATPQGDEAAPARYLFVDINTIDQRLQQWAQDATEVYWVQWFESDTDPRRAVPFLLDQQGERGGEENFQGYSIDWWQLTPPNSFVLAPNLAPLQVSFAPEVQTVAASLPSAAVAVGGDVPVVIRWQRQSATPVTRPLKARVALYGDDGGRVTQRDERLLNDRHLMPAEWSPNDQPLNVYLLEVPDDLSPGSYTIGLLVYDADTLEPISVTDAAGNPTGVEATIGSVEIVDSAP